MATALTQSLSWIFKKTDLRLSIISILLCSIFYLVGNFLHDVGEGGAARTSPSITIPCNPKNPYLTNPIISPKIPTAIPASNATVALDFAAHHTAESLVPIAPAARALHFPPCHPKFSEYTPCEDAERSLKFDREKYVYRERHCPEKGEVLRCRIPAPYGYRSPFGWPESRDAAWYANVPHKHLTVEKAGQNWIRFKGDQFRFPGGGTMFPHGADRYIDDIGKLIDIGDGAVRTAIDTGCGVASWGAYLLSRNIVTMSFAPKDTHEAQVQFALERGVPAMIGIMASVRLPYPARAFDMAHCSRCLIPWGQYGGLYLIEVDRILRPGGYWILSGPPVNWQANWKGWKRPQNDLVDEEKGIENITRSLCWKKLVQKGDIVVWRKATNHEHCRINRKVFKKPLFCQGQDPDKAWYMKMEACLTPLPKVSNIRDISGGELAKWPTRLTAVPPRIATNSVNGVTPQSFVKDSEIWKTRVSHYKSLDFQLGERGRYRNMLDMNAQLGGFAAALINEPVWVMNVVPVEAQVNTLGVIYERGLIGTYQNWCEAMSTYPRSYDFIHANRVFSLYKDKCEMEDILLEMDRILRPQGSVIVRDDVDVVAKVKKVIDGLQWDSIMTNHEEGPLVREKLIVARKQYWTAPAPIHQSKPPF